MRHLFNILLYLSPFVVFSQTSESFSDGDFSSNPSWTGDDSVFVIDQTGGNPRLKSNKLIPNSTFYLSTVSNQITTGQWDLAIQLNFNTSSANYVDWYLTASQANLTSNFNGYFVRLGGTTDEISLYKRVGTTNTKIIDGTDGVLNTSNNNILIKVKKSTTGEWSLERDSTGTGNFFVQEGTIIDQSISTGGFTGFSISQSTASFFGKHFFDNLYIGPIILDTNPPQLVDAEILSSTQVRLNFNESITTQTAQNPSNYTFSPSLTVVSIVQNQSNLKQVDFTFAAPLTNGLMHQVEATNISDLSGNTLVSSITDFTYLVAETPVKGDVIITEFFADPSPRVALSEIEFVEIYNKSNKYFQLNGWKLGDNSTEGTLQTRWLYPGEYVVLVPSSGIDSFPQTLAVTSFPSLNNSSDDIRLIDNNGNELDKLSYTDAWCKDNVKKEGGWTIERINLSHPCSAESNWKASTHPTGGTPGTQNAVWDDTPDTENPQLISLQALAPNYLEVNFQEGMDSSSLVNAVINLDPSNTKTSANVSSDGSTQVVYVFQNNWISSQIYSLTLENVADCWGNQTNVTGTFGLTEYPQSGDIVINEILHDPLTGGSDFVELKNRTNKFLQLQGSAFANFDDDTISNFKTISNSIILKPMEYLVFTSDSLFVKNSYPATIPGKFYAMSLPNYNNDSSTVYFISNGQIIDKVSYTDDFHFKLLDNLDGKSLERINPEGNSDVASNWTTAAESIGFATPGKENSQFLSGKQVGDFAFTVPRLSPDQDGFEDILQLNYVFDKPNYYVTVTIYDERGRLIKELVKSELVSTKGTIQWDGVTDKNLKASIGTYVMLLEATDLNGGTVLKKRLAFLVAGKI